MTTVNDVRLLLRGVGTVLLVVGALALLAGVGFMVADAARGVDAYAELIRSESTREAMERRVDASISSQKSATAAVSLCCVGALVAGVAGLALRLIPLREADPIEDLDELIAQERAAPPEAEAQRSSASSRTPAGPPADRAG